MSVYVVRINVEDPPAMDPKTKSAPADTPWSSVAQKSSDSMWDRLAALSPEDLQKLVSAAVEDARTTLSDHRSTFDDRVSEETLSRTIGNERRLPVEHSRGAS